MSRIFNVIIQETNVEKVNQVIEELNRMDSLLLKKDKRNLTILSCVDHEDLDQTTIVRVNFYGFPENELLFCLNQFKKKFSFVKISEEYRLKEIYGE